MQEVTAVWLRTIGEHVEVLVANGHGEWTVVIREYAPLQDVTISHIKELP